MSSLYLSFKMFNSHLLSSHLLRGSLDPHMRKSIRIMVKWLNSSFPNSLNYWNMINLIIWPHNSNKLYLNSWIASSSLLITSFFTSWYKVHSSLVCVELCRPFLLLICPLELYLWALKYQMSNILKAATLVCWITHLNKYLELTFSILTWYISFLSGSFSHGFTYSVHSISCAAAIEALKIYKCVPFFLSLENIRMELHV